jgi:hypothetical protein
MSDTLDSLLRTSDVDDRHAIRLCFHVSWIGRHLFAVAVIGVAVAVAGGALAFARPTYHPYVQQPPPFFVPYKSVTYSLADARKAFAHAGIRFASTSHQQGAQLLSTAGYLLEVDVLGDPQQVRDSGWDPYHALIQGHWVAAPRTCGSGVSDAERWRGNVRVVVSCPRAGAASNMWLRRATSALGRL